MIRAAHRIHRESRGPRRVWVVISGFSILGFVLFFLFLPKSSVSDRFNVLVASDPVTVWSWSKSDGSFTVVSVPSDTVIDSVHGHGNYSLSSLWKLGFIDREGGSLLTQSLSDALGVPIDAFVGETKNELTPIKNAITTGRRLFSIMHLPAFILGHYQTNMSATSFIPLALSLGGVRSDAVSFVDLGSKSISTVQIEPDGTKQHIVDVTNLDLATKGLFEDEKIRKEGISVTVYNTTNVPSLGNRAARLLTNIGVLVISVGNDEPAVNDCKLSGSQQALMSYTARVVTEMFHCRALPSPNDQTDLTLRLGNQYAKKL